MMVGWLAGERAGLLELWLAEKKVGRKVEQLVGQWVVELAASKVGKKVVETVARSVDKKAVEWVGSTAVTMASIAKMAATAELALGTDWDNFQGLLCHWS